MQWHELKDINPFRFMPFILTFFNYIYKCSIGIMYLYIVLIYVIVYNCSKGWWLYVCESC